MQPASAVDIQPAVSLLGKTPQLLETLLGDLPGELLHWKPRPDRWSISEVLAHLAALEQVYAERVLRIMAEDSPPLAKYDLDGAKARQDYMLAARRARISGTSRARAARRSLYLPDFRHRQALALPSIPNSARLRSCSCSMNGLITIWATCARSRNFIARALFTPIPAHS